MSTSRHVSHSVTVSWYRIYSIMGYNGMDSVFVGLPNSSSFIAYLNIVTYVMSLCVCVCACMHLLSDVCGVTGIMNSGR